MFGLLWHFQPGYSLAEASIFDVHRRGFYFLLFQFDAFLSIFSAAGKNYWVASWFNDIKERRLAIKFDAFFCEDEHNLEMLIYSQLKLFHETKPRWSITTVDITATHFREPFSAQAQQFVSTDASGRCRYSTMVSTGHSCSKRSSGVRFDIVLLLFCFIYELKFWLQTHYLHQQTHRSIRSIYVAGSLEIICILFSSRIY